MLLFETEVKPRLSILPRDYQNEAVDNTIRLWDSGTQGALVRAFTGAGKTIIAAMLIDIWLSRGDDYRAMVLSYEQQLVGQFAQEVKDVLGIDPGIEMDKLIWHGEPICVASRQSLLPKSLADETQKAQLATHGLNEFDMLTASLAQQTLRRLSKGEIDCGDAQAKIDEHNSHWATNAERKIVSRVHRFDYRYNWMIVADEAHKFAYKLKSIGHIHDWFSQNDKTRWLGITATPKRSDGVSIGHKMFPGVALDFPLYSPRGRCAIREGYAVPYRQKYICVEGVDFKSLKKVAGDFDDSELERVLGTEEQLAKLVEPLLDLCDTRKTLIFSPTVDMAKNVSAYINARAKCKCECGKAKWYPSLLIGDGATCPTCQSLLDIGNIVQGGDQCHVIHESIPTLQRKEVYNGHQSGKFQFLSVCGLCKEGYNDPDIACVAVFRPVSKAASSLAEQMKGRGSRPLRGLINGMATAAERREAIEQSAKPDCLIVDLVGITGLADCASTALIYSEGLPDEVKQLAEDILVSGEIEDVEDAIEAATQRVEADKERIKQERLEIERRAKEEAKQRSKANAEVEYSTHDVGTGSAIDPSRATDKQLKRIRFRGMEFSGWEPSKKQAWRISDQLDSGMAAAEVAHTNRIPNGAWKAVIASGSQIYRLRKEGYRGNASAMTPIQASNEINRRINPVEFYAERIGKVADNDQLTTLAKEIFYLHKERPMSNGVYESLLERGRQRRASLSNQSEEFPE